ncbi:transglutaminase family protein [Dapis sp. BLCC M229]|uniref:transglutaminase family protein n=1 Tax=Dapis sp. BLCC M229 TaxID=3400188 RepID=UPI003CF088F5
MQKVIGDLQSADFGFEFDWFAPFFEFRFPTVGEIIRDGLQLELRYAIEPWHVLGEETTGGGTARYVDDSMERLQVMLRGAMGDSPNQDSVGSR